MAGTLQSFTAPKPHRAEHAAQSFILLYRALIRELTTH